MWYCCDTVDRATGAIIMISEPQNQKSGSNIIKILAFMSGKIYTYRGLCYYLTQQKTSYSMEICCSSVSLQRVISEIRWKSTAFLHSACYAVGERYFLRNILKECREKKLCACGTI